VENALGQKGDSAEDHHSHYLTGLSESWTRVNRHATTFFIKVVYSLNHYFPTQNFQFKILAPCSTDVPGNFRHSRVDTRLHEKLIFETQMVRGLALRECGPAEVHLLPDGRHFQSIDTASWHILLQNGEGCTLGCARYRPLQGGAGQLCASSSTIASSNRYGPVLKSGIENLIAGAKLRKKHYGEAGGWALCRELRGSTAAVNVALMTFALAEHLGSGLAITTATRKHHSASILCRIGAHRLAELPAYYEPRYGSIIEVLHFDLPNSNPRYAAKLNTLREKILQTPVICSQEDARSLTPMNTLNLSLPELFTAQ
jgi:hypothetical protein